MEILSNDIIAYTPGLFDNCEFVLRVTPVFVACSTYAGEGLVKLIICSDVPGRVEEWPIPRKPQVSECATGKHSR